MTVSNNCRLVFSMSPSQKAAKNGNYPSIYTFSCYHLKLKSSAEKNDNLNQLSERREASVNCTLHGINQFASRSSKRHWIPIYYLFFFVEVQPINIVWLADYTLLRHTHANEDDSVKIIFHVRRHRRKALKRLFVAPFWKTANIQMNYN